MPHKDKGNIGYIRDAEGRITRWWVTMDGERVIDGASAFPSHDDWWLFLVVLAENLLKMRVVEYAREPEEPS